VVLERVASNTREIGTQTLPGFLVGRVRKCPEAVGAVQAVVVEGRLHVDGLDEKETPEQEVPVVTVSKGTESAGASEKAAPEDQVTRGDRYVLPQEGEAHASVAKASSARRF
jgi:hypothetical protein